MEFYSVLAHCEQSASIINPPLAQFWHELGVVKIGEHCYRDRKRVRLSARI